MNPRGFLAVPMICIILDLAKSIPVQQEPLDGASAMTAWEESNKVRRGMYGQKTTPSPWFMCFDSGICRTKLEFCSEQRKACEKCEDYNYTCGTKIQPAGCTQYCVDLLVAKKLQEIEEANIRVTINKTSATSANTYVTSEKPPESKEMSETLDFKWILIGILGLVIILLLVIWGFWKRKQLTTKENPEIKLELLGIDDKQPFGVSSLCYSSVPQQPDECPASPDIASAPSMSLETSDPEQTNLKGNKNWDKCIPSTYQGEEIGDLSPGHQQQADKEKKNSAKLQQRDVGDESTSSGYNSASGHSSASSSPSLNHSGYNSASGHSSASSSPSLNYSTQIHNQITINVNANSANDVSTSPLEGKTQVEDPNANIPFGKQESGRMESGISLDNIHYKNQSKPVSDENKFAQIVLSENTMDLTDGIKELDKKNVT